MLAEFGFPLENTLYNAEQAQLWMATRTTGVYSADANLAVSAVGGMRIAVNKGIAWLKILEFGGIAYGNTDALHFDLAQADGVLKRIDRIVVRHDYIANKTMLAVKQGAFASSPTPPAIVRTLGIAYEIALADILVDRGATQIIQGNITDKRLDESVCGIMSDGVTKIPTATLISQWESWFTNFKTTANGSATELTDWIFNFKQQTTTDRDAWATEFVNWIATFKANKSADFLAWFNQFKQSKELDFTTWSDIRKYAFDQWFETIKGRLGTDLAGSLQLQILDIERELFTTRNIDNLLQFPNCKKVVTFSESRITTTITNKNTGVKIAMSETTFLAGTIQKVITLFEADGVSYARRETYTTTFGGNNITTTQGG